MACPLCDPPAHAARKRPAGAPGGIARRSGMAVWRFALCAALAACASPTGHDPCSSPDPIFVDDAEQPLAHTWTAVGRPTTLRVFAGGCFERQLTMSIARPAGASATIDALGPSEAGKTSLFRFL